MSKKRDRDQLVYQLIHEPETVIEQFDLIYVNNQHLSIRRQQKGKVFQYILENKVIHSREEIERINQLVIPPAWEDVRISRVENGHLQAVGRDLKKRKQYRYHSLWNKVRNQTKFYRMLAFGQQLPHIRKQVDRDLDQKNWSKTKVIALVVKLMEVTHIRIGNQQYATRNKTYGLSTMRTKHVIHDESKLRFEFVGKRGKEHRITIRNKKLIRLVNQSEEIPGWELFQFYDSEGEKHKVESGMINSYLNALSGKANYTAKDFRTWSASVVFFNALRKKGCTTDEKQKQANILNAFDEAANALGNTRTVCRKYYVHPTIVESYENNTIQKAFDLAENSNIEDEFFSEDESAVLFLLKKFVPKFLD